MKRSNAMRKRLAMAGFALLLLAVTARAQSPAVKIDWDNACTTCDQTRLYRNGIVLATLTPAILTYLDANVAAGQTNTYALTNSSLAGGEGVLSAAVTVTIPGPPPPPQTFTPIRVNNGDGAYTGSTSGTWAADNGCTGGSTATYSHAISGTTDQKLYQSERWGTFTCTYPVPVGSYSVTLKFAENSFSKTYPCTNNQCRTFNVALNGNSVLSNFDIVKEAGGEWKVIDKTFSVTTNGNPISIAFTPGTADQPSVNAIQITSTAPPPQPAVSVSIAPTSASVIVGGSIVFTATVQNTTNTLVTWSANAPNGMFTGATIGTSTVTVTSVADPSKSASAIVTVTAPPLSISCATASAGVTGLATGDSYSMTVSSGTRSANCSGVK